MSDNFNVLISSAGRRVVRTQALRAVKVCAEAMDRVRTPREGVVVLIYHRVGRRSSLEVDLPEDLFVTQMEFLAGSGRAASLDDALAALMAPSPPERDPVVVTFDDGTEDFAEIALPIMEGFGIPSTVYVATDFVERGVSFPHEGKPLSWAALRDCLSTKLVTVGSHTHTHALLDRVSPSEVEYELDRSLGLIEERLDIRAEHFAYPKAVAGSPAADAAVRSRFVSAAVGGSRANAYGSTDPFRIARSGIQVSDAMRWFRRKLDGGMALEGSFRRLLDRYRYARATI
jgi:peptidoglycan/xylan/chitin deacetylase (PgdA/CDA1 family)